ncbi:hypothetical protein PAXRUDRAFT_109233, partial [Paxillus rubicundulus Ve08.2h10]
IFQLRTGHALLNKHLHCITRSDTVKCPKCTTREETIHHFLAECPAYKTQCLCLRQAIGRKANNISSLLNDASCIKHMLAYLHDTKCFCLTHRDL